MSAPAAAAATLGHALSIPDFGLSSPPPLDFLLPVLILLCASTAPEGALDPLSLSSLGSGSDRGRRLWGRRDPKMAVACSISPIKVRISPHKPRSYSNVVRSSKAEGPLRRPSVPTPPAPPSISAAPPAKPAAPAPPPPQTGVAAMAPKNGVVTLEFQRKMAKEMQEYFRQKKLEQANTGPFFGFLGKNEIANGRSTLPLLLLLLRYQYLSKGFNILARPPCRWAMFGFAVGLLTEYATGADFVQQLRILLSNFGIVDLD